MKKHFESIQGDHGGIAQKLNDVSEFCTNIIIHNVMPGVDQFQRPVVVCFIEFQFESYDKKDLFELKMRPKKLSII